MPVTGGAGQLGCGNRQSGLPHAVNRQSPMGFWSTPRAFAKSQAIPTCRFFCLEFFLGCVFGFWAFLGGFPVIRRVQKHHRYVLQKLLVENLSRQNRQKFRCQTFPDKIDKNFDASSPSTSCLFYRVFGCSQRWEFKHTTKNVLQKIVSKVLPKKSTKNPTDFFSVFFY
jgi:hypothetical protein